VTLSLRDRARGAARFLALAGVVAAGIAAASLVVGVLIGASAQRSVSLGFYVIGSLLLVLGFFHGVRGPIRTRGSEPMFLFERRALRLATREEREESLSTSALFVLLGLVLVMVGTLTDSRYGVV
jgi:hypothetical protein